MTRAMRARFSSPGTPWPRRYRGSRAAEAPFGARPPRPRPDLSMAVSMRCARARYRRRPPLRPVCPHPRRTRITVAGNDRNGIVPDTAIAERSTRHRFDVAGRRRRPAPRTSRAGNASWRRASASVSLQAGLARALGVQNHTANRWERAGMLPPGPTLDRLAATPADNDRVAAARRRHGLRWAPPPTAYCQQFADLARRDVDAITPPRRQRLRGQPGALATTTPRQAPQGLRWRALTDSRGT